MALDTDKICDTAEQLARRVDARFSGSGLSRVAVAVTAQAREAVRRAEAIRRPIWWLRISLMVLGVLLLTALVIAWVAALAEKEPVWERVLHVLDLTKGGAVYVLAFAVFVVTLEYRLKRRRALRALHELRALAHIIDMHQLTKDASLLGQADGPKLPSGALMTAADVTAYLHYCTELLSLLSKLAQLYVQDFADPPTLAGADQFENLATGLTQKIWQKLMILDRVQGGPGIEAPAPSRPPAAKEGDRAPAPAVDHRLQSQQ
jgi:hypothetical protein